MWAHPRSRGENTTVQTVTGWFQGSSPLTRGKPDGHPPRAPARGLIPAHAGKTKFYEKPPLDWEAHPRSRGENRRYGRYRRGGRGSSPLTRGKPERRGDDRAQEGLIPAHAGKTRRRPARTSGCKAHPRSRGENPDRQFRAGHGAGSSPLTRGKPQSPQARQNRNGLIPAHAGKTAGSQTRAGAWRAHPRSRGENVFKSSADQMKAGSSPLTRGKPTGYNLGTLDHGLIPAHAGKTSPLASSANRRWAHPRSRGENRFSSGKSADSSGSSPLTRGKRARLSRSIRQIGLIPAHAGKTAARAAAIKSARAHPRSRGENTNRT